MKLTVGGRYFSRACTTEVIVIKTSQEDVALRCAGWPMAEGAGNATTRKEQPDSSWVGDGNPLGRRFVDATEKVELLVVKSGDGVLAIDEVALVTKAAKTLPASD